jgi:hypothetical protein
VRFIGFAIALFLALPGSALAADDAPTVSLAAPAAGPVAGPVEVTANASDDVAVAKVEFRVRGVLKFVDTTAPYTGTFLTGTVPDGPAPIKATAFDSGGQTAAATVDVTIDNTKPSLSLSGPDKARFFPGSTQSWAFDAADGGTGLASVRCSVHPLNTTPTFGSCTSAVAFVLSGQPEGLWTFSVRATDAAGNFAQQGRDFKIDGTAPETTLLSGLDDGATTTDTSLTWELEANENATFECRIVPGAFAPCSGGDSHVVSGVAPGTYTFEARATDLTGNADASPVRRTFTIAAGGGSAPGVTQSVSLTQGSPDDAPQIEVALSFSFVSAARATKLRNLVVKNIPAGATVSVSCPSGCARKTYRKTKRKGGQLRLTPVTRSKLKVGTEITVTVSKPGSSSAVKVLTIRARKAPLVTTLCQPEGSPKPAAC